MRIQQAAFTPRAAQPLALSLIIRCEEGLKRLQRAVADEAWQRGVRAGALGRWQGGRERRERLDIVVTPDWRWHLLLPAAQQRLQQGRLPEDGHTGYKGQGKVCGFRAEEGSWLGARGKGIAGREVCLEGFAVGLGLLLAGPPFISGFCCRCCC